jgi:hypothetical protein
LCTAGKLGAGSSALIQALLMLTPVLMAAVA